MNKKQMILCIGLFFSLLFALFYYGLFTYLSIGNTAVSVYMNQVGLYKEEDNYMNVQESLEKQDIDSYIIDKDDIHAVVTGISLVEETVVNQQETLKELGYASIMKEVKVKDQNIINTINTGDFSYLIAWMNEQN